MRRPQESDAARACRKSSRWPSSSKLRGYRIARSVQSLPSLATSRALASRTSHRQCRKCLRIRKWGKPRQLPQLVRSRRGFRFRRRCLHSQSGSDAVLSDHRSWSASARRCNNRKRMTRCCAASYFRRMISSAFRADSPIQFGRGQSERTAKLFGSVVEASYVRLDQAQSPPPKKRIHGYGCVTARPMDFTGPVRREASSACRRLNAKEKPRTRRVADPGLISDRCSA